MKEKRSPDCADDACVRGERAREARHVQKHHISALGQVARLARAARP